MHRVLGLVAAFFGLACCWTSEAHAVAPPYVSDEELAAYPIIVVAKWDKAPVKPHHQYVEDKDFGQAVIKIEAYTRLNILAVINGIVKPGEHELMINSGITWQDDGTYVNSGTSTQLPGDVEDVTKPCLWFLTRTRSWDEKRKDECLTVANYREVQPLELKTLYVALRNRDAQTEVPKLLAADKPRVAHRVLRYICGGAWPSPYDGGLGAGWDRPDERGKVLHDEANRVWSFLQTDAKDQRPLAACIYAELAGGKGIARMRTLLDDKDPNVRGIALAVLARHRDAASLDRLAKAAEGLRDGTIACQVIKELSAWREERTVPVLIGFLQNDEFAYQYGDDVGIPAIKAQQALLAITGHEFPFDVETSQKAWEEALRITNKPARKRLLEKLAPGGQTPFTAEAVGLPAKELSKDLKERYDSLDEGEVVVTIRLRNVSSRPVTILKEPSEVDIWWPAGRSSRGGVPLGEREKLEFTTIPPTKDLVLEVILTEDFLIAEPADRRLRLSYLANGSRQGVKAWMGNIDVKFGTDWKYKREVKHVEERWKNGNLKATGTTVNGVKFGEWNYFNEQGDRIRIEYPGTGRGTAICNSEHPDNKGAGKRQAK